jgi:hypothetical protein
MRDNGAVIGRIQLSFIKIRSGASRYKVQYPWSKIRNGNSIGSYLCSFLTHWAAQSHLEGFFPSS